MKNETDRPTQTIKTGKICNLEGVRELNEGFPVTLWRDPETLRLVVVAENEGGNNSTAIDLNDLLLWLESGPLGGESDAKSISVEFSSERDV
jgi:hypothetical protein